METLTLGFEAKNPGLSVETILEVSDRVYQQVSEEIEHQVPAEQIYHLGFCSHFSWWMVEKLRDEGFWSEILERRQDKRYHQFVDLGTNWVVDGTWQQKLPQPDLTLPKVLICQKDRLAEVLTILGVPLEVHHFWLEAKPKD